MYVPRDQHDDEPRKFDSVYVGILNNVPVNRSTTAHITVTTEKECTVVEKRLKKFNFNVPVITRKTSYLIDDLFEKIVPQRQFKQEWKRAYDFKDVTLPDNVREFSQEVTTLIPRR